MNRKSILLGIKDYEADHLLSHKPGDDFHLNVRKDGRNKSINGTVVLVKLHAHGILVLAENHDYMYEGEDAALPGIDLIPFWVTTCGGQSGVLNQSPNAMGGLDQEMFEAICEYHRMQFEAERRKEDEVSRCMAL